jgi:serine/threonine protein kinase/Flp pilus assembly protein TadD
MKSGTTLGHYDILSPIGRGGMGEVWKARDTRLGREVAIKTLPPEFSQNKDHLARFQREARAASALNHPNICIVHDLSEHDGQPFIVMELLRGESLAEKMAHGSLGLDQALEFGMQLADGLDAAHNEGIIHRDINPANIFITDRDTAKLLDFGLARVQMIASMGAPTVDDITDAGAVLGTISYMSPEQARGEELDARSDLFSLGVVFYEMVTGQPAFTGNTSAVIFERIFNKSLDPPTGLNPRIPKEVDALIDGLLEKDRNQRSSSARDLKTAISRVRRSSESRPAHTPASTKKSIVVLPFEDISPDNDNEYFSDGLTDEIITDLSQIEKLRVISRNSSMQLKGSGKDLKTIASELDVRYVLEGSVRKAGNAVRVTAQLIDPAKDEHLWAKKYSGKLEDIFEIQEQISRQIVDALKMRLSSDEDQKLAARPIDNVKAFECYHRARQEIYKFTEDGLDRALELIQTALDTVGDNELLYAAQGTAYWQYWNASLNSDRSNIDRAEECARKVFDLNSDSAAGHILLGMVRHAQGRVGEAIRSYKRVLATDPGSLYASVELARIYSMAGYEDGVRSLVNQSLTVDPLSAISHTNRLAAAMLSGHSEVVREDAHRLIQSMPEFPMLRLTCAMAFVNDQQLDSALEALGVVPEEKASNFAWRICLALKLALSGQRSEAIACLDSDVTATGRNVEWGSWWVAECYAFLDEDEIAIDWLETAFERGMSNYPYLSKHDPIFRKLDDNPRFQTLLSKVKIAWERFEP